MPQRADGRFQSTATIAGKKRFFYSRESQEDADRLRDEALALIRASADPRTFAELVYGPWRARVWPTIRRTTRARYDSLLRLHILPPLGHLELARLRFEDVQGMMSGLERRDGQKGLLSPKTRKHVLVLVREILGFALKLGLIERNPAALVKVPKVARRKARQEPPEDFVHRLMNEVRNTWLEGPVVCALFLGLRRGEICALRWADVDRARGTVSVRISRTQTTGGIQEDETKTDESRRTLGVPAELIDAILRPANREGIYLYEGRRGGPLIPNELSTEFPKAVRRAGLPAVTLHDLRSMAATNLAELGADLVTVMAILGHTKIDTTLIYARAKQRKVREALQSLTTDLTTALTTEG